MRVANAYAFARSSPRTLDPETGLGGKLFYAGELDEEGRALVVAANIAGAATLAATADRAAQKQALRDGVADFVVNNLDEALRILKNQLRKRETVAVCVALPPSNVESEMNERGVSPDLLRRDVPVAPFHEALMLQENAGVVVGRDEAPTELHSSKTPALVTWRVDSALTTEILPDSMKSPSPASTPRTGNPAAGCVSPRAISAAWRTACAFSTRTVNLPLASASASAKPPTHSEIASAVEIHSYFRGQRDEFRIAPAKP